LLAAVAVLLALDLAAARWGVDTGPLGDLRGDREGPTWSIR
jgi:hypothetical protein